jgi:hypothetical protein
MVLYHTRASFLAHLPRQSASDVLVELLPQAGAAVVHVEEDTVAPHFARRVHVTAGLVRCALHSDAVSATAYVHTPRVRTPAIACAVARFVFVMFICLACIRSTLPGLFFNLMLMLALRTWHACASADSS